MSDIAFHEKLFCSVSLLIIDNLGMRKLPATAAEDLLEIVMRRYENCSTLLTSNRPVEDWGKLLGDSAAVAAMLDRLLHHGHVLKCGPRSWRTKNKLAAEEIGRVKQSCPATLVGRFYKGKSQEKSFPHGWKVSCFPAPLNEQSVF